MRIISIGLLIGVLLSTPVHANCQNTADFDAWLSDFKQNARQAGITEMTLQQTSDTLRLDNSVIQRDRAQGVFAQTSLQFSSKKVSQDRLTRGRNALKQQAALFKRIEQRYGVPAEVLTAFWGLETDFGTVLGDFATLTALATLAYDCRRPERFRPELLHALWLVQKGDIAPKAMRGAWAGELGQLQFLPSGYHLHGVDFDGDGQRNIIASKADALASAANLLQHYGWQAGQPWLLEVSVPTQMDWSLARLDNKLPLTTWIQQGVKLANGAPLPNQGAAALLLPMGRNGPAFLAYANFDVFLKWNESSVYSLTAAYFALRLSGASALRQGNATVAALSPSQVRQVQQYLRDQGFRITKIDGMIGQETMRATQQLQQKRGWPADGYPDLALFKQLTR